MNYYNRHIGDYARDTAHLSLLEHGVYTVLLDRYYATEQPIPVSSAAKISRVRSPKEREALQVILDEFFVLDGDVYRNNRADEEILAAQGRIEVSKNNGKKGGRPKKENPVGFSEETQQEPAGFSSNNPVGNPNVTREKAHQSPSTSITPERSLAADTPLGPGEACAAMRRGGQALQGMNSSHAVLLEALRLGATAQQFEDTAREGASSGKSFGWVVATVKGRLTDAKQPGANHVPAPRESLVQRAARKAVEQERARQALGQDDDGSVVPDDGHVWPSLEHDVR